MDPWSGTGLPEIFIAKFMHGATDLRNCVMILWCTCWHISHQWSMIEKNKSPESDFLRSAPLISLSDEPSKTQSFGQTKNIAIAHFQGLPCIPATTHRADWHGGTAALADLPAQKLAQNMHSNVFLT